MADAGAVAGHCDCPTCAPEGTTRPSWSSSSTSRRRPRHWRKEPWGCTGAREQVSPNPGPSPQLGPWLHSQYLSVPPPPRPAPSVPAEPPGAGAQGLDAALLAVELENQRLEDELLALKVRRARRADVGR